jgi:hypothetical protein
MQFHINPERSIKSVMQKEIIILQPSDFITTFWSRKNDGQPPLSAALIHKKQLFTVALGIPFVRVYKCKLQATNIFFIWWGGT